jgi:hypothetical protein
MNKSITDFKIGDRVKQPNRDSGIIDKILGEQIRFKTDSGNYTWGHYTITQHVE